MTPARTPARSESPDDGAMDAIAAFLTPMTGLAFEERALARLDAAVATRVRARGLGGTGDYLALLTHPDPEGRGERDALLSALTITESFFLRDPGQMALLQHRILPELIARHAERRRLRIWSAGCATGEEPYSLAILLDRLLPGGAGWTLEILGTDINAQALEQARQALYPEWALRATPSAVRAACFEPLRSGWRLRERFRAMVRFQQGNLMAPTGMADVDLILCRNLLIYLTTEAVEQVAGNLTQALAPDGWLVTGHAELLGLRLPGLRSVVLPESVAYRRTLVTPVVESVPRLPVALSPKAPVLPQRGVLSALQRVGPRCPPAPDASDPLARIRDLADRGAYEEAAQLAEAAIRHAGLDPKPYYLLAGVRELQGRIADARGLLDQVLYLDPNFVPAYLDRAVLAEQRGDSDEARRLRHAALRLLRAVPPESLLPPYENLTAGALVGFVKTLLGEGE